MSAPIKGISVTRLHYTADPSKSDPAWREYARAGYSEHKFQREFEMDAHAGALTAIFGKSYRSAIHERPLTPRREWIMRNAWDFGQGFPARVWFQRTMYNGVRVYASVVGTSIQLRPFIEQTIAFELNTWGDVFERRADYCDPAGNQPKDDGMKSVEILRLMGWFPRWRGSRIDEGIEAIEDLLLRNQPDGEPMFLIDPRYCGILIHAFKGGYRRDAGGAIIRDHAGGIDAMDSLRYGVVNTKSADRERRATTPPFAVDPVSGYGRAAIPAAR